MQIGASLRRLREKQGLTLEDVAHRANVSAGQVSRWELGTRNLDLSDYIKLCDVLSVLPGDLLPRSGEVPERLLALQPIADDFERVPEAQKDAVLHSLRIQLVTLNAVVAASAPKTPRVVENNVVPFPQQKTEPRWTEEFPIDPESFVEKDFDYPLELHALEVEEHEFAAGETGIVSEINMAAYTLNTKDVRDSTHRVIKVNGDSMAPEFEDGWKLLIDTRKTKPQRGEVVAVYLLEAENEGGIIGYWEPTRDGVQIDKANPRYKPVKLGDPTTWKLVGTVQKVVDAPVKRRKR